ncbi:MAG TPA: hypothetical protein VKW06_18195 [Candidatus Angelobacter sp.]|nr:hypothetical protein [Candidatus Angelobacter sp.]
MAVSLVTFVWTQNAREKDEHGGPITSITFSPDGQSVVLSREQGDSTFLYRVPLTGGPGTRLTSATMGVESAAAYSPDGKHIAYVYRSPQNQHSHIFVMDADGNNTHPLFASVEDADDLFPKFARNGKIYFARSTFFGNYSPVARPAHHDWDIYSTDIDGQNVRPLTHDRFYEISEPSLSADGSKIMFSTETQAGSQLQIYALDSDAPLVTAQPHVPNEPKSPIYAGAIFSPDGRSVILLAASQGRGLFSYDVYRMDLASKTVEQLTTASGYSTLLCLSPDGKRAAFLRWTSTHGTMPTVSRMYLLDLATKQLVAAPISGTR